MKNNKEDGKAIIVVCLLAVIFMCSLVYMGYAIGFRQGRITASNEAYAYMKEEMEGYVLVKESLMAQHGLVRKRVGK